MTCGKCVGRVKRALQAVSGVLAVEVNLADGEACVEGGADAAAMIAALAEGGYPAQVVTDRKQVELAVENMTCGTCAFCEIRACDCDGNRHRGRCGPVPMLVLCVRC